MIEIPAGGLLWATGMKHYWPRIFRYLELSSVAYQFGSLAAADESYGRTTRTSFNVVEIQFHPLLADMGPSSSLRENPDRVVDAGHPVNLSRYASSARSSR